MFLAPTCFRLVILRRCTRMYIHASPEVYLRYELCKFLNIVIIRYCFDSYRLNDEM